MKECDVAELYRRIGKRMRENGADRVILLHSRKHIQDDGMTLELAADGSIDKQKLEQEINQLCPQLDCSILDLNEEGNEELLEEAMEYGILL